MDNKQLTYLGGTILIIIVLVLFVMQLLKTKSQDTNTSLNLNQQNTNQSSASPLPQVTQLKIEDTRVGSGSAVKSGDTITVNYKGTLLNGQVFDSSYGKQPFSFQIGMGRVIPGWDQGLIGMQVGGERKLTIPSDLAYGVAGQGPIPPNSPLIFTVELLSIQEAASPLPSDSASPSASPIQ